MALLLRNIYRRNSRGRSFTSPAGGAMKKSSSSGLTDGDGYKGNISRRNQKMLTPAMNEIEARVIISLF